MLWIGISLIKLKDKKLVRDALWECTKGLVNSVRKHLNAQENSELCGNTDGVCGCTKRACAHAQCTSASTRVHKMLAVRTMCICAECACTRTVRFPQVYRNIAVVLCWKNKCWSCRVGNNIIWVTDFSTSATTRTFVAGHLYFKMRVWNDLWGYFILDLGLCWMKYSRHPVLDLDGWNVTDDTY